MPSPFCPDCGDKIINAGAHFERCYGQVRSEHCDCPAGMMHQPDCFHVTAGENPAYGPGNPDWERDMDKAC